MKRVRLQRWSGAIFSPRTRPAGILQHRIPSIRHQSSASPALKEPQSPRDDPILATQGFTRLTTNKSRGAQAKKSAKLSALHARLSLKSKVPLYTLARTLIDATADSRPKQNNASLAVLGGDLLSNYTSEYLITQYPRLPMSVLFAAMYSYIGPKALAAVTREWGVEMVAEPGPEVDPGLLQFRRLPPDTDPTMDPTESNRPNSEFHFRRGISSRTVYDDEFGDLQAIPSKSTAKAPPTTGITVEAASATFVRALVGAIYVHGGKSATQSFFQSHFLTRQLSLSSLFDFHQPTRDLSRLCAREGFEPPIARMISETGRHSRHPVFVVGVYSGKDKLGEGAGASLDEARVRAAASALKGWYLYSPLDAKVPSSAEEEGAGPFKPLLVDMGEVVV